ncbi:MAG: type II toxin-antitoxin system prevent-host-death family antitoxin [Spirochaetales bacterium]|nr:type II toxin-antitoxin system prevent-host-death family antitoxin [Spirochaetales bacterium]
MMVFTYSEARQKLAKLLDEVNEGKEVLIRRKDGTFYTIEKTEMANTVNSWPGVETGISREKILDAVREGRERD